jgi:DNA-directed RNA polymerase III subunit RPC11
MRTHLKRKEVDDVLGGKDSWANVDSVDGESSRVESRGM